MSGFLAEIGKKLAERWVLLLVLPGLLYCSVAAAALQLGHRHPFDIARLQKWINSRAPQPAAHSPGTIVLAVTAILIASTATGLTIAAVGRLIELSWSLTGKYPPLSWLKRSRRKRWERADQRISAAIEKAASTETPNDHLRDLILARDKISTIPPKHPLWIGDRLYAASQRIYEAYQLDLESAWPRIWLIIPDAVRSELKAAHDAYSAAARLTAWSGLYLVLTIWWWPAALIALAVMFTARVQARGAATILSDLTEAAVDIYGKQLATEMGIAHEGVLTHKTGLVLTRRLRKDHFSTREAPVTKPLADRLRGLADSETKKISEHGGGNDRADPLGHAPG